MVQSLYVITLNPILVNSEQQSHTTSWFCQLEAVLKCTTDLSSIIWTTLIIYSCYATIVQKKNIDSKEMSFLIISFLFPLLLSIV